MFIKIIAICFGLALFILVGALWFLFSCLLGVFTMEWVFEPFIKNDKILFVIAILSSIFWGLALLGAEYSYLLAHHSALLTH